MERELKCDSCLFSLALRITTIRMNHFFFCSSQLAVCWSPTSCFWDGRSTVLRWTINYHYYHTFSFGFFTLLTPNSESLLTTTEKKTILLFFKGGVNWFDCLNIVVQIALHISMTDVKWWFSLVSKKRMENENWYWQSADMYQSTMFDVLPMFTWHRNRVDFTCIHIVGIVCVWFFF